jgi:hypothetical protein
VYPGCSEGGSDLTRDRVTLIGRSRRIAAARRGASSYGPRRSGDFVEVPARAGKAAVMCDFSVELDCYVKTFTK